jgi:hypothetical protein
VDVLISFAQIELLSIASHLPPHVLKQDWRNLKGSSVVRKLALLLKGRVVDSFTSIRFREISMELIETLGMWNTTPPIPKG